MESLISFLPIALALAATGVFAGLLAGLLGVGGGIVIVPVLFFLFQQFGVSASAAMAVATGTSLATIIPTSLSSIRAHQSRGNVDWSLIRRWALPMFVGVVAGSQMVAHLDGRWFTSLFAVLAILVALNMLFRADAAPLRPQLPGLAAQYGLAALVGFLSVMVGIGGGTLGVTLLTAFSYAAHRAVGTSAVFGFIIALPGALLLLTTASPPADAPWGTVGLVNLPGFLAIVPLTVACAPWGAALGQKLNGRRLKQVFAACLALTGLRMLLQVIS